MCLGHTGFAPTHGMCAFPGYTSQVWVALQELSEADPGLHALPRSKQLKFRFSGTPQRRRFSWFQYFVPFPVPSSSSDRCLASAVPPSWGCDLSPPPSLPLSFLGVQQANLLRCAVCLFWGADLWLRPSRQMSTIWNPKESWLPMKSACSLVDNASLGPWLPPSSSGCPHLPVSGRGWAGMQSASSAQSFVLWVGLVVSSVRALHGIAIPPSGLLSLVSSFKLPLGHSALVLTLSNAAPASLPSPCLLVVDAGVCAVSLLGVAFRHVICGF